MEKHKKIERCRHFFLTFSHIFKKKKGFTLVELILVVSLFTIFFGMTSAVLGNFMFSQALNSDSERLMQSLHEARSFSVAQVRDSDWGIYFNTSVTPQQYVLFKGSSYAGRDVSLDQVNPFHKSVSVSAINLNGGGREIVFNKRSGRTSNYGLFTLTSKEELIDFEVNAFGIHNVL